MAEAEYKYYIHILFFHMHIWKGKTTHFYENAQRVWIDKIIWLTLQINCKVNILQHYLCNFQDAKNKTHTQNKHLINQAEEIMHIINIILNENLEIFWRMILLQAELYLKF